MCIASMCVMTIPTKRHCTKCSLSGGGDKMQSVGGGGHKVHSCVNVSFTFILQFCIHGSFLSLSYHQHP